MQLRAFYWGGWEKGLESLNDVSIGGMSKKMKSKFDKYRGKWKK